MRVRPRFARAAIASPCPVLRRGFFAAAAFLAISGCGDSGATDPYQDHAGVFLLQSIAGEALPAIITSDATNGTVRVTTGSLFLSADRRFQETLTITLTPPGGSPQNGAAVATGEYTVVGDSLEFSVAARGATPANKVQARLRGDTLTYSVLGRVVRYLKL
ncbi:MAG TPA: hypothetical protein VMY38_08305 [Gemmatimonadaceae bacterium]|nr:hypothetical protein [Gemmatimonadaceae bacterium]